MTKGLVCTTYLSLVVVSDYGPVLASFEAPFIAAVTDPNT